MTAAAPIAPSETPSIIDAMGERIATLLTTIPTSQELPRADPAARAKALTKAAAWKAATTSGTLSLPPGPLGMATILPDLYAIWRIQAQLVADLASLHGHRPALSRDMLLYCLFRHAASQLARDLVVRVGERILFKELPQHLFQKLLRRIGVNISERLVGRAFTRFLPIAGAVGAGAYAYYDTTQVAKTALALFAQLPAPAEEDEAIPSPS